LENDGAPTTSSDEVEDSAARAEEEEVEEEEEEVLATADMEASDVPKFKISLLPPLDVVGALVGGISTCCCENTRVATKGA